MLAPTDDGAHSRCFISESFDETSHFETTMSDVQLVYHRLTGQVRTTPGKCSGGKEEQVRVARTLRTDGRRGYVRACTQHTGAGLVRGCGVAKLAF